MEINKKRSGGQAVVKLSKSKKKGKVTVCINPPPSDKRCECCGRHISEVKPFGGPGDPLVGDFTGALLVKSFRPMAPRGDIYDTTDMIENGKSLTKDEETELRRLEEKMKVLLGNLDGSMYRLDHKLLTKKENKQYNHLQKKYWNSFPHLNENKFIEKYGKKELENYWLHEQVTNTVEASWECRDCFILSNGAYFEKKCGWRKNEKRKKTN